MGLLIERLNLY